MVNRLRRVAAGGVLIWLCGLSGDVRVLAGQTPAPQSQPAGQGAAQQGQAGQQPPQGQPADPAQPPTFRTGINFVRVDVIVNDKTGVPINDLQVSDFDVTEDNKPQKIE